MINANSTYNTVDSTLITADNYSISCYLVGTGNRSLNSPLNWSSTSGGTPADVLGNELITNAADREFTSDTGFWSKGDGWSISGGLANSSGAAVGYLRKDRIVTIGKLYKITVTVSKTSGTINYIPGNAALPTALNNGVNIIYRLHNGISPDIVFQGLSFIGSIDNISIQEVLCFPNSSNPAIIDNNSIASNGVILSQSAEFNCGGFDFTGAAYTFTLANSAYAFNVYGDYKDSTKRINGFSSTGYLYFKGNSNIYSNGATQGWNRIYFDGVGATFTNQDDWNVGDTLTTIVNGTWISNNFNYYSLTYLNGAFGTGVLNLGSSLFEIQGCQMINNLIINLETSTINYKVIAGGTNYTAIINHYNMSIIGVPYITSEFRCTQNINIANTLTLSGNNASNYRLLVASDTIGTPRTITVNGSIVASNVDFRDITLAGTANRDLSAISGGSGDCGGNSGITFTTSQTQYYKHLGGGTCIFKDSTKWFTDSNFTTSGRVPLPQDDWNCLAGSFNATTTFQIDCSRIGRSCNLEGVSNAVTMQLMNVVDSYGSYVLGQNITPSGDFFNHLYGRGNFFVNTFNKLLFGLSLEAPNCLYTNLSDIRLLSYFRVNWGALNSGTFDFNDFNIVADFAYLPAGITYFGNGVLTFTRTGSYSFWADGTIYSEGSTIRLSPVVEPTDISFIGGNKSFNKVQFSGSHTGNFVISGNNTFNEIIIDKGRKVQVTGGTTQTITGKLVADGSPTENIQITSTDTTPFNLVYAGTGFHQVNYCNISYCNATSDRFYAGKNSTDGGNNTGWKFRSYLAQNTQIL